MSCCVGCRHSSDPELLWLWCRPAAVALIWPLAWELPYAASAALKSKKKKRGKMLSISYHHFFILILFFLAAWGGYACGKWKFLGHFSDNAESLMCWATRQLPSSLITQPNINEFWINCCIQFLVSLHTEIQLVMLWIKSDKYWRV